MRVAYLVERLTQFEAPFYRYVAREHSRDELRVLFTSANPSKPVVDPELGHIVDWGIDLLGDYPRAVAPRYGRWRWLARQVKKLQQDGFDLLVVNGYNRMDHWVAALLARRAGIATALHFDSAAPPPDWLHRRLYSLVLPLRFDLFLGVGNPSRNYLEKCGLSDERLERIFGLFPYAIDVDYFRDRGNLTPENRAAQRARLGISPGQRAVLAVAKLSPREAPWDPSPRDPRRQWDLLRALPHLPEDIRLLVAGDGPNLEKLRLAAEHAPGRVRFLGYVAYPDLPALYAAADLFVHAPVEETWGVSVAEALACGLPVVATQEVGAALALVTPGANGWLYPPGDAAALARRIEQALDLDRQEVAAVNRQVLDNWNYAATWRHLVDAVERLVRRSAS